ncbi:thermonuclease family protein [Nostoc spongiaeforme FACHB-130]|uniref:Thermonuclease family protein n=1 Tax=Nostoc spongiaeforme FACHB-130 TaxID=1357510 RepID=A0ABR8FXV9_9NOSO|nr:thermonuclease family protein [Nostoc spongiaeforme]MBD2596019.1 thermonuclease family protein [Nostoc spongiaeforme FACHB-130]
MNLLWKTGIIFSVIALGSTIIWIVHSQNNSPIAFAEEWVVIEVTDGESMTVRQTDGHQMPVRLCGIDAAGQALSNQAKEKLRSLVAINDNQVMIIPVQKDSNGKTMAEVMAYGKGGVEVSFQEELLKHGLAITRQFNVECPNQLAFENAQKMAVALKVGVWRQLK